MFDARSNTPVISAIWPIRVKRKNITLRPFFIISLSVIFLFNSLGGDLLLGVSWAAKVPSGLPSVGPDAAGSPTPLKELNADTFTIPRELGYIQEAIKVPNGNKTVIHIQDAHCNYGAQKTIAEILGYLTKEYGISAVNCEGGSEDYNLSPFTNIPEKDIREKTSDFFVKEGVVSAAEFFAVNNPQKVKLWGVEDADLYIKNLTIYRDSLSHKSEVERYIKSIAYIFDNLKRHIYSTDLLEFDSYYSKYKDNKIQFKEYVSYLIKTAGKRMIDIKSFSNLYLLSQTLDQEEKINFKKANNEKDEVVNKLKKILSRNELEELMTKVGELRIERISQADFYAYLIKKAKSIKLDLKDYPELQKYIIYISLYSAVDRTNVAKEMDKLEDKIKDSMYENDAQRELGILSKNLILTRNIFNISLTRDDYTYYEEHKAAFAVSNYIDFIDAKAPLYKIKAVLDKGVGKLDQYREAMENFYQLSLERDKAFIRNIKFTDHDRPNSIIITGGFHTENLRELFKNENVSYISIMPKFKNPQGYESPYLKRLAGQRTALENVIDTAIPAVLNLAVINILNKLAPQVEGPANMRKFELAVLIMAAVNRGEKFTLQISKEAYPEGERPDEDKIVTFSKGEGADVLTQEVSTPRGGIPVNAIITKIAQKAFDFKPSEGQIQIGQTPSGPAAATPAVKAAAVIGGQAPLPVEELQVPRAAPVISSGEPTYEAAVKPAAASVAMTRNSTVTRIIAPVNTEDDIAPTAANNRMAENIPDKEIHVESYLAKGDWMPELKKLLSRELKGFADDISAGKLAPRMLIRVKAVEGRNTRQEAIDFVNEFLNKEYGPKTAEEIMKNIRIIQVQIEDNQHFNSSIEFFSDLDMLEIDRYLKGDYGDDNRVPPADLQNNFLSLFKLSISTENMKDFDEAAGVEAILKKIFEGFTLIARPVNWRTFDDWKRSNRELMQSV